MRPLPSGGWENEPFLACVSFEMVPSAPAGFSFPAHICVLLDTQLTLVGDPLKITGALSVWLLLSGTLPSAL